MCGIYGVIGTVDVRDEVLAGITLLPHRGQEAAGILLIDRQRDAHHLKKTNGDLVNVDVTDASGRIGIAHLRYTTTGTNDLCNAQPFWTDLGGIGLAHNGQIENMPVLAATLAASGKILTSTSDADLLVRTFARHYAIQTGTREERVFAAAKAVQREAIGGYACLISITAVGLLALRDPNGIRPLVMGTKRTDDGEYIAFASESVALKLNEYASVTDLACGEAVLVRHDLSFERRILVQSEQRSCGFEYFYFADASSTMEGSSINHVRYTMGALLAERCKHLWDDIDFVTPVPETPRPAANAFARTSGKPYRDVIYKSRHVKRIFISPTQQLRQRKAQQGFRYDVGSDRSPFQGKSVMLIDDSIVRGTNMREVIKNVRRLGARAIHVGVTWPKIVNPCPYGIDMPNLLVAAGRTDAEITEYLGADSVTYIDEEDVYTVIGRKTLCMGCTNGKYPTRRQEPLIQLR
jgi:amidophosphoribosyltransferase